MSEEPDGLVLVYLRRLDEKIDRIIESLQDVQRRVTSLEANVARLREETASLHGDFAGQSMRMDRIEDRLLRIEHRLDLLPAK
ncbi:MAG TPA: hypothetical protein VNT30_04200 [Stellaceae bacterium]|nr:hypothetical protein [Stellaceae bacterium]